MNNKIIIVNGPNINLLGEREQSQYGSVTFDKLKEDCLAKSKKLGLLEDTKEPKQPEEPKQPKKPKQPDFKVSTEFYQVENGYEYRLGDTEEYFWKTKD